MTWFDFGVLIVLVVSVVISLFHGLVREMISLGGWVGGFILAMFFGGKVAGLLPQSLSPLMSGLIGFLLVFAGVLAIAWRGFRVCKGTDHRARGRGACRIDPAPARAFLA